MALPKLKTVTYNATLPISGKSVSYRPYNLGDEKLLISANGAKDSDPSFYIQNTLQVIQNCINDTEGAIVNNVPAVDIKYLLMLMRAKAVGETAPVRIKHPTTGAFHETEIDLTAFTAVKRDPKDYVIALTDSVGLKMREPTFAQQAAQASKVNDPSTKSDIIYELLADSIESVYDGDTVSVIGVDATREELMDFLLGLTTKKKELYNFIKNTPKLSLSVQLGKETVVVSDSNIDFLASRSDTSTS